MENEGNSKDLSLNENSNIFKLEYEYQRIEENIKYQNWKQSMIKMYGKNIKIFECKNDQILFCIYEDIQNYFQSCPICKKHICYFCSYTSSEASDISCCLTRTINTALFISGPSYIEGEYDIFYDKIWFFPGAHFLILSMRSENILFHGLASRKSKKANGLLDVAKANENCFYICMIYIIPIVLTVPFLFFQIFLIFFLFLISIPFDYKPLQYYCGVFDFQNDYFL